MARVLSKKEIHLRLSEAVERFGDMSDNEFCSNLDLLKIRPLMFNHIERQALLDVAINRILGESTTDLEQSRKQTT